VKCLRLPARIPNLNAYSERWLRTVKQECLLKLILFGEGSLWRALRELEAHYHGERNPQGKGNVVLFPYAKAPMTKRGRSICRHERADRQLNSRFLQTGRQQKTSQRWTVEAVTPNDGRTAPHQTGAEGSGVSSVSNLAVS
jgi:hypothetical protein